MNLDGLPTSRINRILVAVNYKVPKDEADLRSDQERECYDDFWEEAEEHLARYGFWPTFEMGEIEYDDPILDIYGED